MKKNYVLFALAVLLIASRADAGNCTFRTFPTGIAFGNYSTTASPDTTVSGFTSFVIRCTPNTTGSLSLNTGTNASNYVERFMANGGALLGYNLYDENNAVFGDGNGGSTTVALVNATSKDKDFPITIYGASPQGSDVPTGFYTDTITATLRWDVTKTTITTFTVTADVIEECTVTTTPVDFGVYDPVGANKVTPLDAPGSINVLCTVGTSVTVSLGPGQNFASGTRRMLGPSGSYLNYQLFREASRSSIWSTTPNTLGGTSTSVTTPIAGLTVFGRVAAGQDPIVGLHNDSVLATVNY